MNIISSKKSLVEKLGIKENFKIIVINSPKNYDRILGKLPKNVIKMKTLKSSLYFIQFFTKKRDELETKFPILKKSLSKNGILWISWPKGSSKVKTDLNRDIVMEIGLRNKLVNVKICSINETWSALKFVYRLKDR